MGKPLLRFPGLLPSLSRQSAERDQLENEVEPPEQDCDVPTPYGSPNQLPHSESIEDCRSARNSSSAASMVGG